MTDGYPQNNAERLARYKMLVDHALDRRAPQVKKWDTMRNLYKGKHWEDGCEGEQPVVNMCWSTVNTITASTTIRNPALSINPLDPTSATPAALLTKIINHDWDRYRWQAEIQSAVKDSLVMGFGAVKVGYYFGEVTPGLNADGDIDGVKLDKEIAKLSRLGMTQRRGVRALSKEEIKDQLTQSMMSNGKPRVLVDEYPLVERISPYSMLFDPSVKQFRDSPWVAMRTYMTIESVKRRSGWSNVDKVGASTSITSNDPTDQSDYKLPVAAIIEFYDLVEGTVCIFAEGASDFLRSPQQTPYAFGHPFTFIVNEEVPDCLWPVGEIEQIEPLQRELNATRADIANDRMAARAKTFVPEAIINREDNKERLDSTDENVIIPFDPNSPDEDPRQITTLEVPQVSPSLYPESSLFTNDIMYVSGISDYQRGVSASASTATEAAIINDASQSRIALKLSKIETFMEDIAAKLIELYQTTMRRERIVRFSGAVDTEAARSVGLKPDERLSDTAVMQDGDLWRIVNRADLAGQFDFKVEAGSSQPLNPTQKRQTAQQLAALLFPLAGSGIIDIKEVLRTVLGEGFQIPDVDKFFTKQPPQSELGPVTPGSAEGGGTTPLGGQVGPAERSAPVPVIR